MRLGTYWLVRIGIVLLLTGLVFFGTYAYQNYIGRLGPGGKLALLYVASAALLGVGAWLHRGPEKMRNYAQVLIAGGLAAVYFTTYAAHHVPQVKVIDSALLDGALLFVWAAFISWLADRVKSEVLALFAVLLAFYSSSITHAGLFTLYSNLVLTAAAVFFLVRNRWAVLTFATLVATYASYGFWRFYHDGEWRWAGPTEGLWTGVYFLMAYWLLFTGAVFLSRHEQFAGGRRVSFLSLNNGAFFTAFILTMLQVHQGGFWKFSLAYGTALLALAELTRRVFPTDKLSRNAYLTQGLLLVTLGFITYYSGLKLAITLGVESVILVILARQMQSRVMQVASVIAGVLAAGWTVTTLERFDRDGLITGSAVGTMLLFNAFWLRSETTFEKSGSHIRNVCFTLLALATWVVTTWQNTVMEWRGLVIAVESVAFIFAARPLGNQVLTIGAHVFAALATGHEVMTLVAEYHLAPLAERVGLLPGTLVGAAMVVCAFWEERANAVIKSMVAELSAGFFSALGLVAWLSVTWVFTPPECLAPTLALETIVFTFSYYALRLRPILLFGQAFLLVALCLWLNDIVGSGIDRPWWNSAILIAVALGLAQWWQWQKKVVLDAPSQWTLKGFHALMVVAVLYFWLERRMAPPHWLALAGLLAVLLTVYAAVTRFWLLAAAGQFLLIASAWEFGDQLWVGKPEWYFALVPMFTFCLLAVSAVNWLRHHAEVPVSVRGPVLQLGQAYRVVAMVMSLWWVHKYVPARELCWSFAVLGLVVFGLAGWRRSQELLIYSAIYTFTGLARFCQPMDGAPTVYWPNLLAIIALLAQQRLVKRFSSQYKMPLHVQTGVIIVGGLALWLFLSRWILLRPDKNYLTAGWSALALILFITGMFLKERAYRWIGLGLLGCALCRVIVVDVWRLETIYRVLSFMALGLVLMVLGFIYNKYQEKLKEWL